jgi:hypothetical protein
MSSESPPLKTHDKINWRKRIGRISIVALTLLAGCVGFDRLQHQTATTITPIATVSTSGDGEIDMSRQENPAPTKEQIDFISNNGQEPIRMITDKFQTVKIIGVGEQHNELDMENFANSVIKRAAEAHLINFLALEIDDKDQQSVNNFLQSGTIDDNLTKTFNQHNSGYKEIFETARKFNIPVLCVDDHKAESRQEHMDNSILNYLSEHPKEKGIFYVGAMHLIHRNSQLFSTLGDKFYSIDQLNDTELVTKKTSYAAYINSTKNKIQIGIENIQNTPFKDVTSGQPYELWSAYGKLYDAIVFLPPNPN